MSYRPRQSETDLYPYEDFDQEYPEYEPDPDHLRDLQMEREWMEGALDAEQQVLDAQREAEAMESIWRVPTHVLKQGYDAIVAWEKENQS